MESRDCLFSPQQNVCNVLVSTRSAGKALLPGTYKVGDTSGLPAGVRAAGACPEVLSLPPNESPDFPYY